VVSSLRYPDSMANLYYSNNCYNDVVCDREALWRADFQEFRQTMQQDMRQMREMMERMHIGLNCNHRYNDTYVDYGIRVRPTPHQRLAPINQPLVYEDLSDDDPIWAEGERFVEFNFSRKSKSPPFYPQRVSPRDSHKSKIVWEIGSIADSELRF
jgi:hypothetical protein